MKKYAIVSLIVLAGCGPVFDTQYKLSPPRSESGRACIFHCETIQRQCVELEELRKRDCDRQSEYDQRACEDQIRWSEGRSPKWYECGGDICSSDTDRCESDFRSCYQSCGGKVEAVTRCVANCDQLQQK